MGRKKAGAKKVRKRKVPVQAKGLGRGDGCAVSIRLLERSGGEKDLVERAVCYPTAGSPPKKQPGARTRVDRPPVRLPDAAIEAFAALGHPQRARMLLALLRGPATYRAIQKITNLKAGPLYHHVNQLRLAGLIAPRQRDLYELTRGGRNLVMLAVASVPFVKDARRRPG